MAELTEPIFTNTDLDLIKQEIITDYEVLTSKKLSPGQAETLLINAWAYREQLCKIAINEAAKQCLVAYARYPMLDYLGQLVGVTRLPASKALCTITFTMVSGHPETFVDAGIRVQSKDGKVVFITQESKTVVVGVDTFAVLAECTTQGVAGSGYAIGDIAIILDPKAYIESAANSTASTGGADTETDDALRERIQLAPSTFSVAGPDGAYIYFAKSAHPAIIDVAVTSPVPGQVNIYPLLDGGEEPSEEIIDAVNAKVNSDKVRPLTDTVVVASPTKIDYAIEVELTLLNGALPTPVLSIINTNLQAYALRRKTKLGIDVIISQIIGECSIEGVYKVEVISPEADIEVDDSEFANSTSVTASVTGYSAS